MSNLISELQQIDPQRGKASELIFQISQHLARRQHTEALSMLEQLPTAYGMRPHRRTIRQIIIRLLEQSNDNQ